MVRAEFFLKSPVKGFPESYTLFGAVCWGIRVLFGEEELRKLLLEFKEDPPFLISSPVLRSSGKLFFPKPVLSPEAKEPESLEDYKKRKKVKGVSYIPEDVFRKVVEGDIRTEEELTENLRDFPTIFREENLLHASINRITWTTTEGSMYNEPVFFFRGSVSFYLYFFDDKWLEKVEASLRFVQIGGNRSTGMGFGDVKFEEGEGWIREALLRGGEKFVSLSPLFWDDTIRPEGSLWEVFPFTGPVDNYFLAPIRHIWKRRVLYLSKGSVISVSERKKVYGEFKEVIDQGGVKVYQYGYAFPLFVKEEKHEDKADNSPSHR